MRTSRGQSAGSRISNVVYRQQCFHDLSIEFRHCLTKSHSFQEHEVTSGHYTLRAQRWLKVEYGSQCPSLCVCCIGSRFTRKAARSCRAWQVRLNTAAGPAWVSVERVNRTVHNRRLISRPAAWSEIVSLTAHHIFETRELEISAIFPNMVKLQMKTR